MIDRLHTLSRASRLRALLESPDLSFLMEAHNGLSAKVVERAGFEGMWASGLAISAALGVRDSNEASWTQVLEVLEFMADATSLPILLDGDTGYGNFNNVRRLVRKLEQRGVAGVCIEDKVFPKTNSFIRSETQPLADIDEFCGRIKAGKDSQRDDDFNIVARVEALIAGHGMGEALMRAEAYRAAGADAILIHSKRPDAREIVEFLQEWAGRCPVVLVPTTYYSTPVDVYRDLGVNTVIWANHLVRASVAAMQDVAATIHASESLLEVEDRIADVRDIFELQGVDELLEAESRYLTRSTVGPTAIVLAASRGEELGELTAERPKAMIPIGDEPILVRLLEDLRSQGVGEVTVVTGYRGDTVPNEGIRKVDNRDHDSTSDLASLALALPGVSGDDVIIAYGDLLVRRYIIRDLLEINLPLTIVVDSLPPSRSVDLVVCSEPDDRRLFDPATRLLRFAADDDASVHGRWIGMLRARGEGLNWLRDGVKRLERHEDFARLSVADLLDDLAREGIPVHVMYVSGHWLDVNDLPDIETAARFSRGLGA